MESQPVQQPSAGGWPWPLSYFFGATTTQQQPPQQESPAALQGIGADPIDTVRSMSEDGEESEDSPPVDQGDPLTAQEKWYTTLWNRVTDFCSTGWSTIHTWWTDLVACFTGSKQP